MQIRYSFSSMVLPAADSRSAKQGAGVRPPDQRGCRPGAGQGARSPALGAGRQSSTDGALSSWLPPFRPRACQGLGPGVRGSPPPSSPWSVLLERGVAKSGRETGGDGSDRQPGAVGAAARSGHARQRTREEKRELPKYKNDCTKVTRFSRLRPVPEPLHDSPGEKGSCSRRRRRPALSAGAPGASNRDSLLPGAGERKLAPSARVPSPESLGSPSSVRAREFAATSPGTESQRLAAESLGPGRWVREERARARLTSAAAAAGRVAPSGQWGNGKECGGFKHNSLSLPGCCQTAGLPQSRVQWVPAWIGKGGVPGLLYVSNLCSNTAPWV
ncbi:hypothetical protein TREES_T100002782 [Tupaia chinensis]|uniref:Uncharacterized protein n=1 Tax=Tupaia chinensis TaxID=246437 RepID=L9L279_TUPCH|nr:hypothetical protein TREES_T100002782 [Tupaia chinensis]